MISEQKTFPVTERIGYLFFDSAGPCRNCIETTRRRCERFRPVLRRSRFVIINVMLNASGLLAGPSATGGFSRTITGIGSHISAESATANHQSQITIESQNQKCQMVSTMA